jgi:hypothetical protein
VTDWLDVLVSLDNLTRSGARFHTHLARCGRQQLGYRHDHFVTDWLDVRVSLDNLVRSGEHAQVACKILVQTDTELTGVFPKTMQIASV